MRGKLLLIWIYGVLHDVHLQKEFGGIPKAFEKLGYESVLIVTRSLVKEISPKTRIIEMELHNSPQREVKSLASLKLLRTIWAERPAIVIFRHPYYYSLITILLYRLMNFGKPRALFIYKMDSDGVIRLGGRKKGVRKIAWILMSVVYDKLSVETTCGRERVASIRGVQRKKLMVVPNSYSKEVFGTVKYSDTKREPIIFVSARIVREKGLESLILAFAKIQRYFPEWKITVAGQIVDHEYCQELLQLIRTLRLDDSIHLLGHLYGEQLKDEYRRSSIFCLPSKRESFGISRVEAIASGLPVVTTEAGCGRDFGRMGSLVVPVEDVDALAAALRRLMQDESLRQRVADEQQKHLITWDDIAKQYLSLLNASTD
jgi:glycosyltransferase involved in cell wall biosynthesis